MKIYLVGGAIRDKILNRDSYDEDYVVVGSNAKEMQESGFISVGKSFPVFIHKEKSGEFALARTEKKIGQRHFDFECFTENVTLEDDLKRRDFTINALAYDSENNKIIDLFNGIDDIKNKILRPISNAFCEDPLRVLRAARFKSEFGDDWKFDERIYKYSYQIKNDLKYLSKERVYSETKKALKSPKPSVFFKSLLEFNVLDDVFPWLFELTKIKYNNQGVSIFQHIMFAIDLCKMDENAIWCVLFHYNNNKKPQNIQQTFNNINSTLSLKKKELEISKFFTSHHHNFEKIFQNLIDIPKMAQLLFKVKDIDMLNSLLIACLANINAKSSKKIVLFFTKDEIVKMYKILKNTNYKVNHKTMTPEQIKSIINNQQVNILQEFIANL